MAEREVSPTLERARVLSGLLASVLVPVAIALAGHWFGAALKEREVQMRFVELAVGILGEKPQPASAEVRSWAVDIIDKFSPVPLSTDARNQMKAIEILQKSMERQDKVMRELQLKSHELFEQAKDTAKKIR